MNLTEKQSCFVTKCLVNLNAAAMPTAGSGTTLEAARLEGYDATGIELSGAYARCCKERLQ